jgi:hypothetical protein
MYTPHHQTHLAAVTLCIALPSENNSNHLALHAVQASTAELPVAKRERYLSLRDIIIT